MNEVLKYEVNNVIIKLKEDIEKHKNKNVSIIYSLSSLKLATQTLEKVLSESNENENS